MPFFPRVGRVMTTGRKLVSYCDTTVVENDSSAAGFNQNHFVALIGNLGWLYDVYEEIERQEPIDFYLSFFWRDDDGCLLVDVWPQSQLTTYGECGPRMEPIVTIGQDGPVLTEGIGCGNTRIVAGREEEYRRQCVGNGGSLEDYIYGAGPKIPYPIELIVPWPV